MANIKASFFADRQTDRQSKNYISNAIHIGNLSMFTPLNEF